MDDSVSRTLAELDDDALDQLGLLRMPIGSDGRYVRIGETVYAKSGRQWDVRSITYKDDCGEVPISSVLCDCTDGREPRDEEFYPSELSHRPPSTGLMLLEMLEDLGVSYSGLNKTIVDGYMERFGFSGSAE